MQVVLHSDLFGALAECVHPEKGGGRKRAMNTKRTMKKKNTNVSGRLDGVIKEQKGAVALPLASVFSSAFLFFFFRSFRSFLILKKG